MGQSLIIIHRSDMYILKRKLPTTTDDSDAKPTQIFTSAFLLLCRTIWEYCVAIHTFIFQVCDSQRLRKKTAPEEQSSLCNHIAQLCRLRRYAICKHAYSLTTQPLSTQCCKSTLSFAPAGVFLDSCF